MERGIAIGREFLLGIVKYLSTGLAVAYEDHAELGKQYTYCQ